MNCGVMMFNKSRMKIVAAIMFILVLLWAGTFGVIYTYSSYEIKNQNRQMLQMHSEMYVLYQPFGEEGPGKGPAPDRNNGMKPRIDPESPKFRLTTFYTVALSYDGEVLEIRNGLPTVHADDDLKQLAQNIISGNKEYGTIDNLTFYKADKGEYNLVAFMDNTVVHEGAITLYRYTLIFGGVSLIVFFFLSVFLAEKIVGPLEASYQKQKQFISDAGHELNTPVSVVSANAELLAREIGDNQWLRNIQHENERMGMLVGQLLELALTENVTPQMEHMDFSRLVSGEALAFESVAYEKNLILHSNIAAGIMITGNRSQLKQLISILLDNAIRHSNAAGDVSITLTKERENVELSVINPGDEIPEKQRRQIFERFYRMDAARNGEDNHYGLGLAIAKAIVMTHHGNIDVRCRNGLVEFRVNLPCVD